MVVVAVVVVVTVVIVVVVVLVVVAMVGVRGSAVFNDGVVMAAFSKPFLFCNHSYSTT